MNPKQSPIEQALSKAVLPPDAQRALAQAAAAGDEEARGKLVEANLRGVAFLAHSMARTFAESHLEGGFDDLFSIGCEGACKAVRSLPANHASPGAFLLGAVRQDLQNALEAARVRADATAPYEEPAADEPDAEAQERAYQLSVLRSLVREAGARGLISGRQAAVLELTAQGHSVRSVGEAVGISRELARTELRAATAVIRQLREAAGC